MTLTDAGDRVNVVDVHDPATDAQRVFLSGVTVEVGVPEPDTIALVGGFGLFVSGFTLGRTCLRLTNRRRDVSRRDAFSGARVDTLPRNLSAQRIDRPAAGRDLSSPGLKSVFGFRGA